MRNKTSFAQKAFTVLLSLALILPGCGGGGGGGGGTGTTVSFPGTQNPAFIVAAPMQTPDHARQAPAIDFDGTLHVGAGFAPDTSQLGETVEHGDTTISSGHVQDGAGRSATVAFLNQFHDENSRIRTWPSPPVVRVAEGTSDKYIDYAVRAVQIINSYLPHEHRFHFSNTPSPGGVGTIDVPRGEIFIDFAPHSEWNPPSNRPYGNEPRGISRATHTVSSVPGTELEIYETKRSRVWINTDKIPGFTDEAMITLLMHEILHSIFPGHPDHLVYPDSIMRSRVPRAFSERILGPVDHDAIQAIYAGLDLTAASADTLGPWSAVSFHLRGDMDNVAFGVASRNGFSQPWASGPTPSMDLAHNTELSGSVTWIGRLLGFTTESESLAGATDLTINLATLRGRIDFTNLEHWGVNATPGPVGSGQTWNDGDLGYSVIVRGNTFYQTGGDAGEVTGAFFGTGHEGMGGVVERSDMSAGFGGTR